MIVTIEVLATQVRPKSTASWLFNKFILSCPSGRATEGIEHAKEFAT
jgi:hypothetical protein